MIEEPQNVNQILGLLTELKIFGAYNVSLNYSKNGTKIFRNLFSFLSK
jgi:hypothetical protein